MRASSACARERKLFCTAMTFPHDASKREKGSFPSQYISLRALLIAIYVYRWMRARWLYHTRARTRQYYRDFAFHSRGLCSRGFVKVFGYGEGDGEKIFLRRCCLCACFMDSRSWLYFFFFCLRSINVHASNFANFCFWVLLYYKYNTCVYVWRGIRVSG